MNEFELKTIAFENLYKKNPDLSMYSDEDASLIKAEIKSIKDDLANMAYDKKKDEGYYERRFNIF